ncbi:hypothetical protein FRC19_005386, partial [Serendipita sp. 401]
LPGIWHFHPLTELRTWQFPFPHWSTIGLQVSCFFVFEDFITSSPIMHCIMVPSIVVFT